MLSLYAEYNFLPKHHDFSQVGMRFETPVGSILNKPVNLSISAGMSIGDINKGDPQFNHGSGKETSSATYSVNTGLQTSLWKISDRLSVLAGIKTGFVRDTLSQTTWSPNEIQASSLSNNFILLGPQASIRWYMKNSDSENRGPFLDIFGHTALAFGLSGNVEDILCATGLSLGNSF